MQEIKVRVVSVTGATKNRAVVKTEGQITKIQAEPHSKVQLYSEGRVINGDQQIDGKNIKLKKVGPNLVIEAEGKSILEVSDFFTTEGASLDGGSWSFAQTDGLVQSAAGVSATPEAVAALSPAFGIGGNMAMSGAAVAFGVGSALGGGGGGGSSAASAGSYVAAPSTLITGVITAGPVVATHDLTVNIYDDQGGLLVSNVFVNALGRFTADVGSYRGAISVKVVNSNSSNADYTDEFSLTGKDLNAVLTAVGVVSGSSLTLNINAITTIAAQKAGIGVNGLSTVALLSTTTVNQANTDVATAFKVVDITTVDPVTTLDATYNTAVTSTPGSGLSNAEKIGALLAALSGLDNDNGGRSQDTINRLVTQLSGGSLAAREFSQTAISEIIAGSRNTDPNVIEVLKTTVQTIFGYDPSVANETSALDIISQAAEGNTAASASIPLVVADYTNAGVSASSITGTNLSAINSALDSIAVIGTSVDTTTEVQRLIDSYNLILGAADGADNIASSATQYSNASLYAWIGVTGVNTTTQAKLLSDVIDLKVTPDVDTVSKVQTLANLVNRVLAHATAGGGSFTEAEFESLGIDTTLMNAGRAAQLVVKIANIGEANVDTLDKIIALIDSTIATPTLTLTTDSGFSAIDGNTNTGAFTVGGIEANATWEYSVDGTNWLAGVGLTFTAPAGTYAAGGIRVRQTDISLNVSTIASNASGIVIDSTAPSSTSRITALDNDTGTIGDFVTNDTSLVISGTNTALSANEYVQLSLDNGSTWVTTTATSSTTWTYDNTSTPFVLGGYVLQTRVMDAASNPGTVSAQALTVAAISALPTSAITSISDDAGIVGDFITNDTSFIISGTNSALSLGDVVQVSVDNGVNWFDAVSNTSSTWSYDNTANTLASGRHVFQTRVKDSFGLTGTASPQIINIDVAAPVTPTFSISFDTGSSSIDNITSNGTMTVGAVELNATWQYSLDGGTIWMGPFLRGTTTFTVPSGTYAIGDILVSQTDVAGNVSTTYASNASVVYVDTTPPTTHTFYLDSDSNVTSDGITNNGNIIVGGVESGATWRYSTDGGSNWSSEQPSTTTSFILPDGTYPANSVLVRQIDKAGNVSLSSAANALQIVVDTGTPAAPTFTLTTDSGTSAIDGITNVGAFTVGGIESGATWQFSTDAGSNWSSAYSYRTLDGTLPVGTHSAGRIAIRQIDLAGNRSSITYVGTAIDIDVTGPTSTSRITDISTDSGTLGDFVTNDTTLIISGNNTPLNADEYVQVSLDNGITWHSTTALTSSTWSFDNTATPFAIGGHILQTRVMDAASNAGSASAQAISISSLAVLPTSTIASISSDEGIVGDFMTSDTSLLIAGTNTALNFGDVVQISLDNGVTWVATSALTPTSWTYDNTANTFAAGNHTLQTRVVDAYGVNGAISNQIISIDVSPPVTPTFSFRVDTGSSSVDNITANGIVDVSGIEIDATWQFSTNGGLSWSADLPKTTTTFTLAEGTYSSGDIQVRQTDLAGNLCLVVASNAGSFIVDSTPPTTHTLSISLDSNIANDAITNDGTINVGGIASGNTWTYSIDGGTNWSSSQASTITSFLLPPNTYQSGKIQVVQTDVAGNISLFTASNSLDIEVDITPPASPSFAIYHDSGSSTVDGLTNDGTINVFGLETGGTWKYSTNGGSTWSAFFPAATDSFVLPDGRYAVGKVMITQFDKAGNECLVHAENAAVILVDNVAPAAPTFSLNSDTGIAADGVTNDGLVNVGGVEVDATWQFSIDGGSSWSSVFTHTTTTFRLPTGTYFSGKILVAQTDSLGNSTLIPLSNAVTIRVDNTPPAAPTFVLDTDTGSSSVDNITQTGTFTVSGVETTATWQYTLDGGTVWSSAQPYSTRQFTAPAARYAASKIQVRQTDLASNVSSSVTSNTSDIFIDSLAPAAPTFAFTTDTGIAGDGISKNGSITVTGVEAGATWQYSVDGGATWLGPFAQAVSTFTLTTGVSYAIGAILVKQTDVAGIESPSPTSNAILLKVDAAAPVGLTLSLAADTGSSASDFITNNGNFDVTGLETNATWQFTTDNGSTWSAARPYTTTSFQVSAGTYIAGYIQVRQTDVATNTSSVTQTLRDIEVDTTNPAAPTATLYLDDGSSAVDNITSNGTITVSGVEANATWYYSYDGGTVWSTAQSVLLDSFLLPAGTYASNAIRIKQVDLAGNETSTASVYAPVTVVDNTPPATPTFSLHQDTGGSVLDNISTNGRVDVLGIESTATWEYTTNGGTNWSGPYAAGITSFTLAAGRYVANSVLVRQTDAAGNINAADATNASIIIIDGVAPADPTLFLTYDTGINNDGISNNGDITVSGLETDGTWVYSLDGGHVWSTAIAGSITHFTLPSGTYRANNIQVIQTDLAGLQSLTVLPITTAIEIDSIAPSAPILTLTHDTGVSSSDNTTNNGLITVSGFEIDATWEYSINGGAWLGPYDSNLVTSFTLSANNYAIGAVRVRQTDTALNTSLVGSNAVAIVVDTSAPATTVLTLTSDTGASNSDGISYTDTITVDGLEVGGTWQYSVNGGVWSASIASSTNTFRVGSGNFAPGTILVKQFDKAGNASVTQGENSTRIVIDIAPPAAPTFTLSADTGTTNSDGITNNGVINVTGIETGNTWQYSTNGGGAWSAAISALTTSFTLSELIYQVNDVQVRQTDVAGNHTTVPAKNAAIITVDLTAPTATATIADISRDSGALGDFITNDDTLIITGTNTALGVDEVVQISVNNGLTWVDTTAVTGTTWSFDNSANALAVGSYNFKTRVIDLAGNSGSVGAQAIVINALGSTATSLITGISNDHGVASDFITYDTTLVINGTNTGLEPGDVVEISVDGGTTWVATTSLSATTWSYDNTGNPFAAGSYSLQTRVADASLHYSVVATRLLTIDTTAPNTPTLALTNDSGSSSSDGITNNSSITVNNIEPTATWEYTINNGSAWSGPYTSAITTFVLPAGTYQAGHVQVRQTDLSGNVTLVYADNAVDFVIDTAALTPTISLYIDTGTSGSDGITSNGTINVGNIETGATWVYTYNNGGAWSAPQLDTVTSFVLPVGTYVAGDIQIKQTDAAGNTTITAARNTSTITVDTVADTPSYTLFSDTGTSHIDNITNNGLITFSGIESGGTWVISYNAGSSWTLASSATTTIVPSGTFEIGDIRLSHTDAAGNTTTAQNTVKLVVDNVALTPTITLSVDSGTYTSDGVTNDGTITVGNIETGATWIYSLDGGTSWSTPQLATTTSFVLPSGSYGANSIKVKQTDVSGNITVTSATNATDIKVDLVADSLTFALTTDTGISNSDNITSNGSITISGLESGATWQLSYDNGVNWGASRTATTATLPEGTYPANYVRVRQTDLAGNTTLASAIFKNATTIVVDTTVPTHTSVITDISDDTGTVGDFNTNDDSLVINGTNQALAVGETVQISLDNGVSWLAATSLTSTTWTYDNSANPLAVGSYTFRTRVVDASGNGGAPSSQAIVVAASRPTATSTITAISSDLGGVNNDFITSDTTLVISGTNTALNIGDAVEISLDNGANWVTTTAVSASTWSYDNTASALAGGNYTFQTRVFDISHNTGSASSQAVTIDTVAPSTPSFSLQTDSGTSNVDGISHVHTITVSGVEPTGTWSYSTDWGTNWSNEIAATTSTFNLSDNVTYAAGRIKVRQTDFAGKVTAVSAVNASDIVIDTVANSITFSLRTDTGISNDNNSSIGIVDVTGIEAGATWQYSTNGGSTWGSALADTVTFFTLGSGDYEIGDIQIQQTDAAGNTSTLPAENASKFVIDSAATAPTFALNLDSGISASDDITNSGVFTVTGVETGATWQYSSDGGTFWSVAIANTSNNTFTLAPGTYLIGKVQVRQTDIALNTTTNPFSNTTNITIDPAADALTLALTQDTGVSSDHITSNNQITVTGIETGAIWKYSYNGGSSWSVDQPDTTHTFTVPAGTYAVSDIQVVQTDAAGNSSTAVNTGKNTVQFVIDTSVATPTITLHSDTGSSTADGVTTNGVIDVGGIEANAIWVFSTNGGSTWSADQAHTITSFTLNAGTYAINAIRVKQIDKALNTSTVIQNATVITVDATAPAATTFYIATDTGISGVDNVSSDGTITVTGVEPTGTWAYSYDNGGGAWSSEYANTTTSFSLPVGSYAAGYVRVRHTDLAGNTTVTQNSSTLVIDNSVAALSFALTTDSGNSNIDLVTNNGQLTISGLETGGTWIYSLDNGSTWSGNQLASINTVTLSAGTHLAGYVQVKQTDLAGNTSSVVFSNASDIVVDTSAPSSLAFTLDGDTGSSTSDSITSNTKVNVTGMETGARWQYSIDRGVNWLAMQLHTTTSFDLPQGVYTIGAIQVRQTDLAGNVSAVVQNTTAITIDTAAPTATSLITAISSDTGRLTSDFVTTDTTLTISGTNTSLSLGETVQLSLDNGTTWLLATNPTSTTWTYNNTAVPLSAGSYTFKTRVIDIAGNLGSTSSQVVVIDNTAPVTPTFGLTLDTGSSSVDQITNNGSITVSGLESTGTWVFSTDGGGTWSSAQLSSTTTTFSMPNAITYVIGKILVKQYDLAGNESAAVENAADVVFDTTAPTGPSFRFTTDTGTSTTDRVSNLSSITVTGVEATATWAYSTDGGGNWSSYLPYSTSTFNLPASGTYGIGTLQVRQKDLAGNVTLTATQNAAAFVLDTVAATPTLTLSSDTGSSAVDNITNSGVFNVGGFELGTSSWEYSTDGGTTWNPPQTTTNSTFTVSPGSYTAGIIKVRQTDLAGNVTASASYGQNASTIVVDQTGPALTNFSFTTDTGTLNSDNVTNAGQITVTGVESTATWQYITDGGTTWSAAQASTTTTFSLGAGTYVAGNIKVRQTDLAGNVGTATLNSSTYVVDTLAPVAPSLVLVTDTDSSGTVLDNAIGSSPSWTVQHGSLVSNAAAAPDTTITADKLTFNADNNYDTIRAFSLSPSTSYTYSFWVKLVTASSLNVSVDDGVNIASIAGSKQYTVLDGLSTTSWTKISHALTTTATGNIVLTLGASGETTIAMQSAGSALIWGAKMVLSSLNATGQDNISSNGYLTVGGIEPTATSWRYSVDAGVNWSVAQAINVAGFTLSDGTYYAGDILVKQTDLAGNETTANGANTSTIVIDTVAPSTPTILLTSDTGTSASDGISKSGHITVGGIESNATWKYTTNGGSVWSSAFSSAVTSFTLDPGTYNIGDIQIKQTDVSGNVNLVNAQNASAIKIDTTAPVGVTLAFATPNSNYDRVVDITGDNDMGSSPWTRNSATLLSSNTDIAPNETITADKLTLNSSTSIYDATRNFSLSGSTSYTYIFWAKLVTATNLNVVVDNRLATNSIEGNKQYTSENGLNINTWTKISHTFTTTASGNISLTLGASAEQNLATQSAGDVLVWGGRMVLTSSISGEVTNNNLITIGALEANASYWQYRVNGGAWSSNQFVSSTSFRVADGTYAVGSIVVRQADLAGNFTTVPLGNSRATTVDTTAPTSPTLTLDTDTGSSSVDNITNNGLMRVTGVEAGATWRYTTNGGGAWSSALSDSNSTFTLTNGTYNAGDVQVVQTDKAGNVAANTTRNASVIKIDTDKPATPLFNLDADTGSSALDNVTSNGKFNVTGIEGTATWQYSTNSGGSWNTALPSSTTSFTLAAGSYGPNTIRVRQIDEAGNITNTAAQNASTIVIDTSAPVAPTLNLSFDSDNTGIPYNNAFDLSPWVVASATRSANTTVAPDGTTTAETITFNASTDQLYEYVTGLLGTTSYTFSMWVKLGTATNLDISVNNANEWDSIVGGKQFSAADGLSTTAWKQITHTFTPTATGNINLHLGGNAQSSLNSYPQSRGTIYLWGAQLLTTTASLSLSASINDGVSSSGNMTVGGFEANSTWQYSTNGGGVWSAVQPNTTNLFTLAEGTYQIGDVLVRQTDLAGNTTATSSATKNLSVIVIDTTAPSAPTFTFNSDTGSSSSDGITQNGLATVHGLETNATWQYSTNSGTTWSSVFSATVDTFTLAPASYAVGAIRIKQIDTAGNITTTPSQNPGIIKVDITAPTAPTFSLAVPNTSIDITGDNAIGGTDWGVAQAVYAANVEVAPDGTLSADKLTLHNSAYDLNRQYSTTNNTSYTYTVWVKLGTATNFDIVMNDTSSWDSIGGEKTYTSADGLSTTGWTKIRHQFISGGNSKINVHLGGNGETAVGSFVQQTVGTVFLWGGSLALTSSLTSEPNVTNNALVNVGGFEANASSWQYSTDGGSHWSAEQSTSISSFLLPDGIYAAGRIKVQQTDAAGNTSTTPSQNTVEYTVDTIAPTSPTLTLTSDTGISSSDGISKTGTFTVGGLESGASWQFSKNGGGDWSDAQSNLITSFTLGAGTYAAGAIRVKQIDKARNEGATYASNTTNITIDTIAPTIDLDSGVSSNRAVSVTDVDTFAAAGVALSTATNVLVETSDSIANVKVAFSTLYNGANEILRIGTTDLQANGGHLPSTVSDGTNTWSVAYASGKFTFALNSGLAATNAQAKALVQAMAYRDSTVADITMGESIDWTLVNATVSVNSQTGADGTANVAERVTFNNSTSNPDMYRTFTGLSANTAYTYTFWVKLGSASNLDVVVTDGSGFNTLAGETQYTGAYGLNNSTYTKINHGFTTNSTGQVSIYLGANSETSLAAQSAGTVDLWGGRLHLAGETYIRTISVSATDSAGNTGAASTTTLVISGTTPLILDLNSDGIHTVGTQAGVVFDVDADGTQQSTGWTDGLDGLLVLDLNHDGVINNGSELFGSGTTLGISPQAMALGAKAADGYAALAQYDADAKTGLADGVIDANDTVFTSLQVWIDTNVDGVTDAGELLTLIEVGVKSLSLKTEKSTATENGNAALLQSTWTDTHGTAHTLADWTLNTVEVHKIL